MRVRVTIDGGARLQAGLRRSAAEMNTPGPALRDAAKAVSRTAARLAAKRTGRMSRSNRTRVAGSVARITNRTRYAPYQEHGTSVMNAHPFMRPAAHLTDLEPYFERHAETVLRRNL